MAAGPSNWEDISHTIKVGQRVRRDGDRGTVLYVGNLIGRSGTWLGIDWDDPQRGKHDGTIKGKRYFKSRYPTSASFVQPHKVDFGISCPAAIRDRYGLLESAAVDEANMEIAQKLMNAPFLKMVGLEKVNRLQSQFSELRQVILDDCGVNGPGRYGELQGMCPKIEELYLSRNLFPDWKSVAVIAVQLKSLKVLDISGNRLTLPNMPEEHHPSFYFVDHIIAGSMDYTWAEMLLCCRMWPKVTILQVPKNCFRVLITPGENVLYQLKFLDLDYNPILNWSEVNKLGKLPCLEELHLSNCGVEGIYFPTENGDKSDLFPVLKTLYLSNNKIKLWESVCELDKLKELLVLKTTNNPLFSEENRETCRQLIIARIGNLAKLDGTEIDPVERKGAEYDYLKKYAKIWINVKESQDQGEMQCFLKSHSRFPALIEKYGLPEMGELKSVPTTLKSKMICVEFFNPDDETQCFKKNLPRTMTIQKIVGLAQKLFGIGTEFPRLAYISTKKPATEIPLDSEFKTLDFFSVEDGDRISVRW